jgi:hypothetical protein
VRYKAAGSNSAESDQGTMNRANWKYLELGHFDEAISVSKILELTPRLARLYAKKSMRSLLRDLAELEKMRLITRQSGSVRAAKEIILAFLPKRKVRIPEGMGSA